MATKNKTAAKPKAAPKKKPQPKFGNFMKLDFKKHQETPLEELSRKQLELKAKALGVQHDLTLKGMIKAIKDFEKKQKPAKVEK